MSKSLTRKAVFDLASKAISEYRKGFLVDGNLYALYGYGEDSMTEFGRGKRAFEEMTRCERALEVLAEMGKDNYMERIVKLSLDAGKYIAKNPRANHAEVRKYMREIHPTASRAILFDAVELAFINLANDHTSGLPLFDGDKDDE